MEDRVKVVKQLTVRWGGHLGHPVGPGSAQGSFDVPEEGRTVRVKSDVRGHGKCPPATAGFG